MKLIKYSLLSLLLFFGSLIICSGQETAKDTLKSLTKEDVHFILKTMDGETVAKIIQSVDNVVAAGKDPAEKASVAYYVYDFYRNSKIMGYEEVAIYIADNYFLNKRYTLPNDMDIIEVSLFADYNRSSMIGMKAPSLVLPNLLGNETSLLKTEGKFKILVFYEDQCRVCKSEFPKMMEYLQGTNAPLVLYRVYTQPYRERWEGYIKDLDTKYPLPSSVSKFDVWDPDFVSDFSKKYGVLSTPKIFLLDSNNVIIGRGLNTKALSQLIEIHSEKRDEMHNFFDQVFSSVIPKDLSKEIDTADVFKLIDTFYESSKKDTLFFNDLFKSLYQYLKQHYEYGIQKGAAYLGTKYMIEQPQMWEKSDLNLAEIKLAVDLFNRNPLGKPVTDLQLYNIKGKKKTLYEAIGSESKYTALFLYDFDCAVCEAVADELKRIYSNYKENGINLVAVYVGKNKRALKKYLKKNNFEWETIWDKNGKSGMYDKYNLTGVPSIYLLDGEKRAIAKDITPFTLEDIFRQLSIIDQMN